MVRVRILGSRSLLPPLSNCLRCLVLRGLRKNQHQSVAYDFFVVLYCEACGHFLVFQYLGNLFGGFPSDWRVCSFTPAIVYYINQIVSAYDSLMGQTANTMFTTAGGIFGSLIGGIVIDYFGISIVLALGVVLSILGTLICWVGLKNKKIEDHIDLLYFNVVAFVLAHSTKLPQPLGRLRIFFHSVCSTLQRWRLKLAHEIERHQ